MDTVFAVQEGEMRRERRGERKECREKKKRRKTEKGRTLRKRDRPFLHLFIATIVGDGGGWEGDTWQGPSHRLNSSAPITSTCP